MTAEELRAQGPLKPAETGEKPRISIKNGRPRGMTKADIRRLVGKYEPNEVQEIIDARDLRKKNFDARDKALDLNVMRGNGP